MKKQVSPAFETTENLSVLHFSFHIVIFVDFHGNMLHIGPNQVKTGHSGLGGNDGVMDIQFVPSCK